MSTEPKASGAPKPHVDAGRRPRAHFDFLYRRTGVLIEGLHEVDAGADAWPRAPAIGIRDDRGGERQDLRAGIMGLLEPPARWRPVPAGRRTR
jgi:hypothetical protein